MFGEVIAARSMNLLYIIIDIVFLCFFIGYAALIVWNIKRPQEKVDIKWILIIGILVQGAWEFILAITGIRNLSLQLL